MCLLSMEIVGVLFVAVFRSCGRLDGWDMGGWIGFEGYTVTEEGKAG